MMNSPVNFDEHFHTSVRPLDAKNQELRPLDLVIINEIPSFHYEEEGLEFIRNYEGKYGLLTYFLGAPHYYDDKSHPGWVSPDGSVVCVWSHAINGGAVTSWDLWIPPENLTRIPHNFLIMNLFSEFPWQMLDSDGPSDHNFVVEGMEQFAYIKRILETPYETLVDAHNAATAVLDRRT
jgi:hypothetical protein